MSHWDARTLFIPCSLSYRLTFFLQSGYKHYTYNFSLYQGIHDNTDNVVKCSNINEPCKQKRDVSFALSIILNAAGWNTCNLNLPDCITWRPISTLSVEIPIPLNSSTVTSHIRRWALEGCPQSFASWRWVATCGSQPHFGNTLQGMVHQKSSQLLQQLD